MDEITCPYCGKKQTQHPIKEWKYLKTVTVSRYKCECGKFFQYYKSSKSSWTIPKKS